MIYYTTNGIDTNGEFAAQYSAPLQSSSTEIIQAFAVASGYSSSPSAGGTYFITLPVSRQSRRRVENVVGIAKKEPP